MATALMKWNEFIYSFIYDEIVQEYTEKYKEKKLFMSRHFVTF